MGYEVIRDIARGMVSLKQEHRISKLLEWSEVRSLLEETGKMSRGWRVHSDNLGASSGLGGRAGGWREIEEARRFIEPSSSASLGSVGQKSLL